MRKLWIAALALTVCAASLSAQLEDPNKVWKPKCARYELTPLPAEASEAIAPKRWPNCNSYKIFSVKNTKPDYEAARKCAWIERLASQAGHEPLYAYGRVFGGSAMLTLLYANGDGVERNIPLAIRFACESGWAPGEIGGRVEHIEAVYPIPVSTDSSFRFCEDPSTGFMEGYCEKFSAMQSDQARSRELNELSAQWTDPQRAALKALENALTQYSQAHGKGEIQAAGDARQSQAIQSQQSIRDSFLAAIRAFEKGGLPRHSAAEAAQAEAELNGVYQKALDDAGTNKSNADVDQVVQPEDIRAAQESWLVYRDAWLAFAKLRYPTVTADSWLTLLTRDRIATIRGEPCDADPDTSDCPQQDTIGARPLP
jgi:hypothetical protein